MQEKIVSGFETAWRIADIVLANGMNGFDAGVDGVLKTASLCGMDVTFVGQMPVSFSAADLDMCIERIPAVQPFTAALAGPAYKEAHAMLNDDYAITYRRGDEMTLSGWLDRLMVFLNATAVRKAA